MENKKQFILKKTETELNFSDLVLPERTLSEIEAVNSALKQKFQSSLLPFYGPSGTGKTLTASLLAKRNNKNLWRVDLASVLSAHNNEVEANLSKILSKGREANVILLLDEAEALFSKRTSVKDSHDKYANIETAKFLNELEAANCFAIFSTNSKSTLDDSFLRRLRFKIDFPMPDKQQRFQLWRKNLSTMVNAHVQINLEEIANDYEITGGEIHNIARKIILEAPKSFTNSRLSNLTKAEIQKRK